LRKERKNASQVIPHGIVPLFSMANKKNLYDSINVAYTVANTTFEDSVEIDALNKPKELSPLLVLTETFGFNGFIWAWDHNHWAINFYGHPYQGAAYPL